jgi:hypothetical protein
MPLACRMIFGNENLLNFAQIMADMPLKNMVGANGLEPLTLSV